MTHFAFCDDCPEAVNGYWATGHSAWERCHYAGMCWKLIMQDPSLARVTYPLWCRDDQWIPGVSDRSQPPCPVGS